MHRTGENRIADLVDFEAACEAARIAGEPKKYKLTSGLAADMPWVEQQLQPKLDASGSLSEQQDIVNLQGFSGGAEDSQ